MKTIPLVDLKALYHAQKPELDAAFFKVMESGWYILGEQEAAFEREFAAWCGAGHCVGVANGTDAVELALLGAGLAPGDVVATVAHTAVATVAAVERMGAIPVLVDVDPCHGTMSPQSLAETLTSRKVNAVLPVHLYGQCADMDAILPLACQYGCAVVEDCAQAHGATLHGRKAGSFGDTASFSFYPTKNLGAFGDGGAVITKDAAKAEKVRLARQYGWKERYISAVPGFNSRLDEMQAAFLRVRLKALDAENASRRRLAALYRERLKNQPGLELPTLVEGAVPVCHLFVVRFADYTTKSGKSLRDACAEHLKAAGIQTAVHYPLPVHQQPAYAGRLPLAPGGLAATEKLSRTILSLPMYAQLSEADVLYVCESLLACESLREL